MGNQEMKLRSGATEHGRIYEQRVAALLSIKCAMDPKVADFWIVSNVDGVGAFDDIIILIEYTDGVKKMYCIQLKHKDNNSLQLKELINENSKFCLKKYQESYEEVAKNINIIDILKDISINQIYFILYTNANLRGTTAGFISVKNRDNIEILNTSTKSKNALQVFNSPNSKQPFDENFLQQFYLFDRQASATQMDRLIKDEFYSHFQDIGNTVFITVTDYFAKWSVGRNGKITRIFKKDVQRMLLEFLLLPHSMEPSEVTEKPDDILNILNDTLTNFNVTAISQEYLLKDIFGSVKSILGKLCGARLNFQLSWNTHLTPEQTNNIMAPSDRHEMQFVKTCLQEKQRYVPYLSVKDLYFSAWQSKIIPLIINCNIYQNSVEEILIKFSDVAKDLSFVLLNANNIANLMGSLKVFSNMNDIKDSDLLLKNLENTYVSLQGKKNIQLKQFIGNTDILAEVTPDVYMTLVGGVVQAGETNEIESYYIKRDLQKPLIRMEVLDKSNAIKDQQSLQNPYGDIFVLVEYGGGVPYNYQNNTMDLLTYITQSMQGTVNEEMYILTTDLPHNEDDTLKKAAAFLHQNSKKAVHVMRIKLFCLEWIFSRGVVEILQEYLIDSSLLEEDIHTYIPEDDMLSHFRATTNIISNSAGMGKTFMLKSVANKFKADEWVCYINLSEHASKISGTSTPGDFVIHLLDDHLSKNDKIVYNFFKKIFVHCLGEGNMVWLLDGYDEVASEIVLSFLGKLKDLGVRTWITTRSTYRQQLEMELDTLSLRMTHFSKNDHVTFLQKYFETFNHIYNYNEEQVQYIITTIDKCSSSLDKTLIGIPLQTRMFAEIFGDDINQISEREKLTVVDLYNKFVGIKLKEYKSYEATSLKKTLSKLALKIFFTEDQLNVVLDFEELAEEALTFQESYKKDSIVVGLNKKGDAVFGHRTFAEFLAAHWLAKQIVTNRGEYNRNWVPLIEKLFYIEMLPVRAFFDRILTQNMPLHLAVLNNDLENVAVLVENEELKNNLDILGRSALHLAVSYGKYYDLYVASEVHGLRSVGLHSVVKDNDGNCELRVPRVENNQHEISEQVVEKLMSHGLTNSTDKLFNYDAFDYAMKSCSLNSVNCLYAKFDKVSLLFELGYNFKIFLYVIAYANLYRILSERKIYNLDVSPFPQEKEIKLRNMFKGNNFELLTIKYNELYLTEVAALTGGKEIIFELIQSGALQVGMGDAVHKACYSGHADIVELLRKMGEDVKKVEEHGWSPIHQAGRRGRSDITYQFLKDDKFRSNLLKNKSTLMTPLHYACQGGHLECVVKLLENGANIKQKDAFEFTPLIYANLYGHANIIDALLAGIPKEELKADTEIQACLNLAASNGYSDCIQKLLECGLNVNNTDKDGNTPLILASQKGFSEVIKELAKSKECDLNLMKTNDTLDSTLWYSCENQHIILHTKLLGLGANRKAHGSISALHFAVRNGHLDCVETLLKLGADKSLEDTISGFCYIPLVWASMYGRGEIVERLLNQKTEAANNQKERYSIDLALMWAAILGYRECVKALLKHPQSTDVANYEDEEVRNQHLQRVQKIVNAEFFLDARNIDVTNENMPVLLAVKNGHANVVEELVLRKFRNNEGLNTTALHWAARSGDVACVKLLVELGVDENQKNEKGLRVLPIVWASMYGKTKVVEYFLSNKSKSYLENIDLHLALNWSALGGHYDCVKILLDFGLDVNNIDHELQENTPLLCACEYRGTLEVIDELLLRHCRVDMKNSEGKTALDFAVQNKKFDIVKRLINSEAYKNTTVDKSSLLYQNLQEALNWAVTNKENELINRLLELGISDNASTSS